MNDDGLSGGPNVLSRCLFHFVCALGVDVQSRYKMNRPNYTLLRTALAVTLCGCNCTLRPTSVRGSVVSQSEPMVSLCEDSDLESCIHAEAGRDVVANGDGLWRFELGQLIAVGGDQEGGCAPKNVLSVRASGCEPFVQILEEKTKNFVTKEIVLACN